MAPKSKIVTVRLDSYDQDLLRSLREQLGAWHRARGIGSRMTPSKVIRKALHCLARAVRGEVVHDLNDL